LGSDIKNIDDLIRIGNTYNPKKRKRYNLNLCRLNKLVEPLTELKTMVGMTEVKKIIFDQIIYYLQRLDDKNVDMLHTVIVGPPGVGKTQLTHIIAKIYNKLGFLKTDKVICAKRDDLVGEYVGQTAPKTRKVLEKALGGVLLLDEVYALSPNSERDFAREAIDMINVYLSEHSHDLVCVIAGYKKPTYENFLAHNEGLARRFTHHFEIKGYTASELTLIFKKYVDGQKWILYDSIEQIVPLIEKNLKIFPNFGGDMTTLFACCKKTHSKRLLLIPTENELLETKKKITLLDIEQGIKLFIDIKEKNSLEDDKGMYMNMYS
jgi:SpoVK/Ycf46/Vps4 family AAA+-type ATPase